MGFTDSNGTPVTIYDPATGDANGLGKTPFPNNTIPAGENHPAVHGAAEIPGDEHAAVLRGRESSPNYSYTTMQPQDRQGLTVRGDYIQSQKSQYAFRYSSGNEDILSTGFMGAGSKIVTNYYQYMGSNTWTISPTVVNEARFGYNHFFNSTRSVVGIHERCGRRNRNSRASRAATPPHGAFQIMAFSQGPTGTTTAIWQEIGDIGGDGPYVVTDPTWQIVDNLSWVKGKHSLRFGFEYNRQTFNQLGNQFSRGQFFAQPISTALETKDPQPERYRFLAAMRSLISCSAILVRRPSRWPWRMRITCAT